jgi:hypothetical protein
VDSLDDVSPVNRRTELFENFVDRMDSTPLRLYERAFQGRL